MHSYREHNWEIMDSMESDILLVRLANRLLLGFRSLLFHYLQKLHKLCTVHIRFPQLCIISPHKL